MIEWSKKDVIALLLLTGIALVSWLPRLTGPIDLRWDGGAYFVLGTSLAQGKGYRLLNEPGEIQTTLHPPLLPVIVALHQLVLRTSDPIRVGWWLRVFYIFLFVAYAVAVYALLRMFLAPSSALWAALVCLLHHYTVFASNLFYPEIPFALATVLFTIWNLNGEKRERELGSTLLAVIAFALRTVGVALLAAWVVESVCQRRFRQAALRLLLAFIPLFGWAGYVAYVEAGREYQTPAYEYQRADYAYINVSYARNMKYKDPFSPELGYVTWRDKAGLVLNNLAAMPARLGEAVSTRSTLWDLYRMEFNTRVGAAVLPAWLVHFLLLFLAALIGGGIGLLLAGGQYFIPLYMFFFLGAVCATPWPNQFNRYLMPLTPFLSLALFLVVQAAARQFAQRLPVRLKGIGLGLAGAVVVVIFVAQAATLVMIYTKWNQKVVVESGAGERIEYRLFYYHDSDRATDAGLDWLRRRVQGKEVVAVTDPQWAYLRIGLKAVLPPFEIDTEKAQQLLDSVPVKYLLIDESRYKKYTTHVVAAYPDRWQRVYAEATVEEDGRPGKFEIYERVNPQ